MGEEAGLRNSCAPQRGQWQPLPGLVGTDGSTMKPTIYWACFSRPSLLERDA